MKFLLPAALLVAFTSFSQTKVTIKKNDILKDGTTIASFDGKGGAFRVAHYVVTLPNSKDSLIVLNQYNYDYENPLFQEGLYLYKITFNTNPAKTAYIRPKPFKGKMFGKEYENYRTKYGKDLIEEIFNDNIPLVINDKGLDATNVDLFLKNNTFDFEADLKAAKVLEDSIGLLSKDTIARKTNKPIVFKLVNSSGMNQANGYDKTFEIYQDEVLLGKLQKTVEGGSFASATYIFWKKIPSGTSFLNAQNRFVPIAFIKNARWGDNAPQSLKIVYGKKDLAFRGQVNSLEADLFLTNLLIANKYY